MKKLIYFPFVPISEVVKEGHRCKTSAQKKKNNVSDSLRCPLPGQFKTYSNSKKNALTLSGVLFQPYSLTFISQCSVDDIKNKPNHVTTRKEGNFFPGLYGCMFKVDNPLWFGGDSCMTPFVLHKSAYQTNNSE